MELRKDGWSMKARSRNPWLLVGLFFFLAASLSARANVYATDIRVNGSLKDGVVVPGGALTISYILNDDATNVAVRIYAGTNVVKTFSSDDGGAGANMTNAGLNMVVWHGTNDNGSAAAQGVYNIRITAMAAGYAFWTNITDDGPNFFVNVPTGIAINKNTNSPYYGRVFVGNGYEGNGMANDIFKYNADGSLADEGSAGNDGYPWGNGGLANPSPWKMDIGSDDRLYVDDWSGHGLVVSFDQVLSSHYLDVLRADNYPYSSINLSGPCVCGTGTNMQIFMADFTQAEIEGLGILSWTFAANGVIAIGDTGTVDVTLTTNTSGLTIAPYAVSVDTNGDLYTIQQVTSANDEDPRVLCFPPPPIGGPPDTLSRWAFGGGVPALVENYGVAVDATATFVAVATRGYDDGNGPDNLQDGGVNIFLAKSGTLVTNIVRDPEGITNQEFIDVAWDNVGNLYALDFSDSVWRVYSPPGSNQATTVAVPFIQVYTNINPPQLSMPAFCMGQLNFTLTGQSNITYVIQQSPDLVHWTPVFTNVSLTSAMAISVSPPDTQDFYRAVARP
jgi:hypothetical protein